MMKISAGSLVSLFGLVFGASYAQEAEHIHKPHPHKHVQYAKTAEPWAF